MGTHKKRLSEALLMNTHNMCFYGELETIVPEFTLISALRNARQFLMNCERQPTVS